MTTINVTVDVDVDLSNIDTDDLLDELESRALNNPALTGDIGRMATRLLELFKQGKDGDAMVIVRDWVQEVTGGILP